MTGASIVIAVIVLVGYLATLVYDYKLKTKKGDK